MFRFLCAPALFLTMIAPAEALKLDCAMQESRLTGNWVTPRYLISVDEAAGKAEVLDGLVKHFEGGPVAAKLLESNGKKMTISWQVKIYQRSQAAIMEYRAAYFKGSDKITIRVNPRGYDNSFEGRGSCKTVK